MRIVITDQHLMQSTESVVFTATSPDLTHNVYVEISNDTIIEIEDPVALQQMVEEEAKVKLIKVALNFLLSKDIKQYL